jgi:uncharacterized glyoxalase superfamily protein PhnB
VPTTLSRIVVSVHDLEQALGFYRDTLGLAASVHTGFASLGPIDGVGLLLHERATSASDTAVAATFTVADLDDVCESWLRRGGVIVDAPEVQPWGERMAVVRDADGHLVCLVDESHG